MVRLVPDSCALHLHHAPCSWRTRRTESSMLSALQHTSADSREPTCRGLGRQAGRQVPVCG